MLKKVRKYYRIIVLVSFFRIKYLMILALLPDRDLIRYLEIRFQKHDISNKESYYTYRKLLVIKRTETVLRKLFPHTKCLVRSVIINETLIASGISPEKIKFGLKKEGDQLYAHAWIHSNNTFEKIYEL